MKRWIKKYLIFTFTIVLLVSILNFSIDPFQQYRKASLYPVFFAKERYLNPGLAKTYDYDSVITGTSMIENFILSNISQILKFNKPIKLSYGGGTGYEIKMIMERVFQYKKIKNVLFGLDVFSYSGEVRKFAFGEKTFPFYLYSDNFLDKYKYLVSLDTTKESIGMPVKAKRYDKNQPPLSYDRMYEWQFNHKEKFGHVNWSKMKEGIGKNFDKDFKLENYKISKLITSFEYNFLPFIKEHTETQFTIFYPPYSILAYKDIEKKGWLNEYFKFKIYINSLTNMYPNLKLYDFQTAKMITHDLGNYKDFGHYHQKINKWMLEQIRDDNYLVTKDNSYKYIEDLKEQIKDYNLKDNNHNE